MPFWVLGAGNWSDAANHWAATTGGAPGAGNLPTSATDAIFDANSGAGAYTITVDVSSGCRDLDFSAAAGTPTLSLSLALTAAGNVVWKAGMVVGGVAALVLSATSPKTFRSNGVLTQTNGFTCNGIGGQWTQQDAFSAPSGTFNLTNGAWLANAFSFTTAGFATTNNNTRTLNLSGVAWTCALNNGSIDISGTTGLTFTAPASLSFTGGSGTLTFNGGGLAWNTVQTTGVTGTFNLNGASSYTALSLVGGAGKLGTVVLGADQTVSGAFKYLGNSAINRLLLQSSAVGTPRTITAGSIDAASNFTDFMDIAGAGTAAPFATGSSLGDAGGNSGITFTGSVTQTATGTASFTWSTHGWTTRVPLPQDDVVISNAFIAGRIIDVDVPRMGRNITCSCTGNPTLRENPGTTAFYGSMTLAVGMATNFVGGTGLVWRARGIVSLTTNGVTLSTTNWVINGPGGTFNLNDAFTVSTGGINIVNGTLNTNGFTFSIIGGSSYRQDGGTVNLGASLVVITDPTSVAWQIGGTLNAGTSTIKVVSTTAATRSFAGGGKTYNIVWFAGSGTGVFQVTGSNSFQELRADPGRSIQFTAGTTNTMNVPPSGTAAGNVTIGSITAASHTLAKGQGGGELQADYLTISRSTVAAGSVGYAGTHSLDGGNNSGWFYTVPPAGFAFTAPANDSFVAPATQNFVAPATQDFTSPASQDFIVPATSTALVA